MPSLADIRGVKENRNGNENVTKQKFNDQNNGCARALKIFVNFSASSEKQR